MTDTPNIIHDSNGIWRLEGEQLWDTDLLPIILEHINPGDTVIDAGAWIGGHTMAYAKKVGSEGQVYAFEPNSDAFECLDQNANLANVRCYEVALGDELRIAPLSLKKGWYDSSYIGSDGTFEGVKMNSLDAYRFAPNFIKIDVEGCELKVLKGAEKTIEKFRPKMVIEINVPALKRQENTTQEVYEWLFSHQYNYSPVEEYTNQDIYNILAIPR